jgi:hypothetical protein
MPMLTSTSDPATAAGRPPRAFTRGVAAAGLPPGPDTVDLVTEADLDGLPDAAARYLRAMGVVGRPRTWSLRAHWAGRFRRGADQPWLPCDAWQYNSGVEVARLFRMRLMVARAVPMWAWDTYRSGAGRMRGKLLNLLTVADGSGPEFDAGELVTWLDDAVLLAPAMLLGPRTTWRAAGDDAFRVAVTDAGRSVSAEVLLDEQGRPRTFRTEDRYADLPGGLVRVPWCTPATGWAVVDGRPRPTTGAAVWQLPEGGFCYAELTLLDLALDVPPGTGHR